MNEFLARFFALVTATLSGFDRLVFRGHLQPLHYEGGMFAFLSRYGVRLVDFKNFVTGTSDALRRASLAPAHRDHRPIVYLESSATSKEDLARRLLAEHPIEQGLICVLQAVEPCTSFEYHRSPDLAQRGLRLRRRKCLHIYHYYLHPVFGFINARIQTWFPFNVQLCLNGREWLAQQLTGQGSTFKRVDNCFTWLDDPKLAQRLMDEQLRTDWPTALGEVARWLNPLHELIFWRSPMDYYWSAYQTEWATDLLCKSPRALASLYPKLVRHAMLHFKSPDVMRFLARKAHGNFTGEIESSFKDRAEGIRVKHWLRGNSVKMYDKAGSVLRIETTIAKTTDFKVLRPVHDDDDDDTLAWRPLRKGVADLHRRAEVSQRSNDAYLEALAVVDDATPCAELFDTVSRPVKDANGRRVRALRLGDPADIALLQAIARGEHATSGFRNRDIRDLLFPSAANADPAQLRRQSARISRLLRILREHGIIRKISKTHRYRLSSCGQLLVAALFATRSASIKQLIANAA
jgi:hypothetical protein